VALSVQLLLLPLQPRLRVLLCLRNGSYTCKSSTASALAALAAASTPSDNSAAASPS
jgi:hypothetical protein